MIKMMKGEKVTGGTVFSTDTPETYCAMANAGYDFIWTEMQHNARDWDAVGRMWKACPHAKAVPGVRVAYTDEREIQHAMDLGALVIVIPTVRSVEEGTAARDWTMYPPLGKRSLVVVAVVVKASPFTTPVAVAVRVGLAVPYVRLASAAVTLSGSVFTVNPTLAVAPP